LGISIYTINDQVLSIESSDIKFKSIEHHEGQKQNEFLITIPPHRDQYELVIKSQNSKNLVRLKPYIPRLKWRLKNQHKHESFRGVPINLDFDAEFTLQNKPELEIQIFSRERLSYLFLIIGEKRYPVSISDEKNFLYSFPLNSIYEEILEHIKREGVLSFSLIIEDQEIQVLQIIGEIGEFFEHEPPKPKRRMRVDHSKKIRNHQCILTELKIKGYDKSKPKRIVATLISIISDEFRIDKMRLFNMIFSDHSLEVKVNQFLSLNNSTLKSGMTYGDFLAQLWDKPLNKMEEMIRYIESNLEQSLTVF
jgi:hypothetical protein